MIGEPSFAGIVGLTNTAFTCACRSPPSPLKQWTGTFCPRQHGENTLIWRMRVCRCRRIRCCRRLAAPSAGADAVSRAGWRLRLTRLTTACYLRRLLSSINVQSDKAALFCPAPSLFHHLHGTGFWSARSCGRLSPRETVVVKPFHLGRGNCLLSAIMRRINATSPLRTIAPAAGRRS